MDKIVYVKRNFPSILYSIPKLRNYLRRIDYNKTLSLVESNTYDFTHFEYIDPWNCQFVNEFNRISRTTIATPWGSDVFRPSRKASKQLPHFFSQVDVVTSMNETMRNTLVDKYLVDNAKIVELPVVGTIALDNIVNHQDMSRDFAKQRLGLDGRFTIVCGTNASPAQRHELILQALIKAKPSLPKETTLLFLLGRDGNYDSSLLKKIEASGFEYKCFQRRITDFEMLLWRKAADMMIHAQISDSASGAVVEALLCGTTIVNGEWLRYQELERWGVPYYIFDSFENLPTIILTALKNEKELKPSESLIRYIKSLTMREEVGRIVSFYKHYNQE